jgi:hypothetical protein
MGWGCWRHANGIVTLRAPLNAFALAADTS